MSILAPGEPRPALVVFVDRSTVPWLRPLRPGFRHCFAALQQDEGLWLVCDPLKDRIELAALEVAARTGLAAAYLAAGHRICRGRTRVLPTAGRMPLPPPLTCVGVVKRLLGVRAPGVITPWQLYRHLTAVLPEPFIAHEAGAENA